MKKILLSLFAILLITSTVLAQQNNREKIKALKTSYITNALNLSPKEAEKFWPVYNQHSNKIQKLKMQLERGLQRKIKLAGGVDNITNAEAQELIDQFMQLEQQITDSKLVLIKDLSEIITAKKIIALKKAERDFNRKILREYGKRRRMQGN